MIRSAKLCLLASGLALACAGAHAESVGNVGAVNQTAHGTPPGQSTRKLSLGAGVENRERIDTSSDGSAQINFRDTSTMTVGRNSSVTVDHFVYSGCRRRRQPRRLSRQRRLAFRRRRREPWRGRECAHAYSLHRRARRHGAVLDEKPLRRPVGRDPIWRGGCFQQPRVCEAHASGLWRLRIS